MQNRLILVFGGLAIFLLGILAGLLLDRAVFASGGGQITFTDGKTLEVRLNELEQKVLDNKTALDQVDEAVLESLLNRGKKKPSRPETSKQYEFKLDNVPWKGAENPKVVVVEFADFQCPYCKRFDGIISNILKKYPNDVRFYFKTRLIHDSAMPAHEAGREAYVQGKFWDLYEILYKDENFGNVGMEQLEKYASQAGLDMEEYAAAMEKHAHQNDVAKEDEEARKNLINATPTVFINGYYLPNHSEGAIISKIDEILKK